MPCKEVSGQAVVSWEEREKKGAIRLGKARDLSQDKYVRGELIPSLPALKNKRNIGIWKSWFGMSNMRQIYKALIFQRG